MFVSNNRGGMMDKMLRGIPHAVVLENVDGDLATLVPAILPTCVRADSSTQVVW